MWKVVKTLNLKDLRSKIERQRKEKERRARSKTSHGRTPQFMEDRSRVHFATGRTKDINNFMQKTVVENSNEIREPKHTTATNSDRAEFKTTCVLHTEGGWQKEINPRDTDLLERTIKKMQKEETYMETVPLIAKEAEYLVRQNNTIRLCDSYKKKPSILKGDSKPFANVVSVYKCPSRGRRPISKILFSPDQKGQMAVAYCPYEFDPNLREYSCEAFFWDMENSTRPECMIRAPAQIVDLSYHPKDAQNICGALFTGQVAKWDNRVGPNPQTVSKFEASHEDVCTSAMWINSKTGYEFFSCGLDGMVIWWDERNLSERLDMVYADPEKGRSEAGKALPITVLDYEHTLPTKFLVGSQFGHVMVFMKKGKTPQDRLMNLYNAHKGPVRSIHRNPVFIKNFMSCGDYHLRIFAEDCRDSGIMWTAPSEALYTYAHWLPGRPCGLVASRTDGCLEFWDLLLQGISSILTTKVSEDSLSTVCPSDTGTHVAAGTINGDIRMVKVCPSMQTFDKSDKSALAACFDRESRREKYLEQRNREMRLAKKHRDTKQKETEEKGGTDQESPTTSSELLTNENLLEDKMLFEKLADEKTVEAMNSLNNEKSARGSEKNNASEQEKPQDDRKEEPEIDR